MMIKRKIWGFVFVVLALMVILSGCESGSSGELSDVKDVRIFAGSVGPGDFINIEVNVTDGYLDYEVKALTNPSVIVEQDRIGFSKPGSDFYVMDNDDRFLMLGDEVLIATDKAVDEDTGEEIITALKEMDSNEANQISGKYNIITSLEGAPGIVDFQSGGIVEIKIDLDGNGSYSEDEESFTADYSYKDDYKALEIIENNNGLFKHYGVFLDGDIGIFDSYVENDSGSLEGDGMSILVKQNLDSQLSDFAGTYNFIDVDGYNGEISISINNDNTIDLTFLTDDDSGTERVGPVSNFDENTNPGLWSFRTDMSGNGSEELWTMMLFEKVGKEILIVGVTEDGGTINEAEDKYDGLFGWDGDESHGGMIIGVKQ